MGSKKKLLLKKGINSRNKLNSIIQKRISKTTNNFYISNISSEKTKMNTNSNTRYTNISNNKNIQINNLIDANFSFDNLKTNNPEYNLNNLGKNSQKFFHRFKIIKK